MSFLINETIATIDAIVAMQFSKLIIQYYLFLVILAIISSKSSFINSQYFPL